MNIQIQKSIKKSIKKPSKPIKNPLEIHQKSIKNQSKIHQISPTNYKKLWISQISQTSQISLTSLPLAGLGKGFRHLLAHDPVEVLEETSTHRSVRTNHAGKERFLYKLQAHEHFHCFLYKLYDIQLNQEMINLFLQV